MNAKRPFFFILSVLLVLLFILSASAMEKPLTQSESELTCEGDLPSTCAESNLMDLIADAVLEASGSQLALLPAQSVTGTLEQGAVFQSDLERIIPVDQTLVTASFSPAALRELLEIGVSHLTRDASEGIDVATSGWDGFPQLAGGEGFSWEYDVSAPVGERVQYIKLNGENLDLSDTETTLTVTSVSVMFDGSLGYAVTENSPTNLTLRQIVHDYCTARDSIAKPTTRSNVIGTSNYTIISKFPKPLIFAVCIFISLFVCIPKWKSEKLFTFKK